jgi:signal transduction histidine kinase
VIGAEGTIQEGAPEALRTEARREPAVFRAFAWSITAVVMAGLVFGAARSDALDGSLVLGMAVWLPMVVASELLAVPLWDDVMFSMSLPVLIAAGIVFGPWAAGALGFLGFVDAREWRGEVSLARAVSNRSGVALSASLGALAFHGLAGDVDAWPQVLFPACAALIVDGLTNAGVVVTGVTLRTGESPARTVQMLYMGSGFQFVVTYVSCGAMALLLAASYVHSGSWGLLVCLAPLFLAGQMLAHGRRLLEASRRLEDKSRALEAVAGQMADERADERLQIASALHDDVLQSLHYLTLNAQVIREDLRHGRLLQLEEDIPLFLQACRQTSDLTRSVVTDLRSSPLGRGGGRIRS